MPLTPDQIDRYTDQGYLMLEGVLDAATVAEMRAEIARLLAGASGLAAHTEIYDLEDSHRPEAPRVRRVKQPHAHTPFFDRLVRSPAVLDPIRQLLGPDIRLQNSKLNLKSAGYGAAVEWHQDWAFYPHTNDDILAIGILVNDVDEENGPLMVLPGSHRGPVHDHHHAGLFCGAIDTEAAGIDLADAVKLTGPAGSMSIHHVRMVHGSDFNRSGRDRGLLLYELCAGDAWPLAGTLSPYGDYASFQARMLCGQAGNQPRLAPVPVRIPAPLPADASSIYQTQSNAGRRHFSPTSDAPSARAGVRAAT
ncbi:MAG: phytanoyl-CoA dioxygenase family protein [Alphaproteobacteria bacterium]